MNSTKVNSVVPTVEWNLELEIIPVVLRGIGYLADELSNMGMGLSSLLSLLLSINQIIVI